jgi:hypothetical protein
MIEELKEKCEALALRKREELERALDQGEVADPLGGTIIISLLVSSALAAASYLLTAALTPKPPRQQLGKLSGSLQLMNSEQGIMIPEIYGASPTVSLVAGSNPTYADIANCTQGAGGAFTKTSGGAAWDAGGSHNTSITSGDAFFKFTVGVGYSAAGFSSSSTIRDDNDFLFGIQWNPDKSITLRYSGTSYVPAFTTWETSDQFHLEIRSGRFRIYKGSAEIVPDVALPAPTYPLYAGIAIFTSSAGVSASKIQIGSIGNPPNYGVGGIKVPAIIIWTSGIRKNTTVTTVGGGGKGFGGGGGQEVENISYDIDLALKYAANGPHRLLREYANADVLIDQLDQSILPSGVYDPGVGADADYDPEAPPDPQLYYSTALDRLNADITYDGDGTGSGDIQGGGSGFTVYTGTATQQPDPLIEADIDGRYGTGSTPAYRNHSYIVHQTFSLSRWGGIVPNMTAVWEHETLKTLDDIFGSLCERVNVKAATNDYDFSGISAIPSRGMLISGRLFSPAEIIGSPDIQTVYNYFVTEAEGQIIAFEEGDEPSVTIPDTEVGWMDSDGEVADILPEVDTVIASEIELARQVDVKYIDPEKDWDANTQSDNRQITEGVSTELLEVQLCLLPDEARSAAQRKLYRDYVMGTAHKFTLPWTYLYLYPGYKITITRAEGFTHVLKLTSISGGIGILECEGVAIEPASFTQPASGSGGPPWIPPLPIPAMTIISLLDCPLLRDGDETVNYGIGFYMAGVPRTGVKQKWTGYALYANRNNEWVFVGSSTRRATIGTVVSVTALNTTDTSVIDRTGTIVVDLYGTTEHLESITEATMLADATKNVALMGEMIIQYANATQVSGYPNRWQLFTLLNGRRGTEKRVTDSFVGKKFVVVNEAVKFVPARLGDRSSLFNYRAVTVGQSLGDAATVPFTWTGKALMPLSPVNIRGKRDSDGNLLIKWTRRSRVGPGMIPGSDVPLGEEIETYDVEIMDGVDVARTMSVSVGSSRPAFLVATQNPSYVSVNNLLTPNTTVYAYAIQQFNSSGDYVEGTLVSRDSSEAKIGLLGLSDLPHWGVDKATGYQLTVAFQKTAGLTVVRKGEGVVYTSGALGERELMRIRILMAGSEIRFYWDYMGPGSVPFYVYPTAPKFGVSPIFSCTQTTGEVRNITVGQVGVPSVVYSASQQQTDFGSLQASVDVRVAQVSSIVGRGDYGEATI